MGKREREKGKRGEQELARTLRELFACEARRGQQYEGSPDSPDIKTDIEGVEFESKRVQAFYLYPSLEKAHSETGPRSLPVVCHRKDGKPWVVVCYLHDLPELARRLLPHLKEEPES